MTSSNVEVDAQKHFGRYYTPPDVAASLARWAIDGSACRVLDPSYGTCHFLVGALNVFAELGVDDAAQSVYGVDLDVNGWHNSRELRAMGVPVANLIEADFFDCEPGTLGPKFPAVVGNPPYIRHHRYSAESAIKIRRCIDQLGTQLSGRADMWAAFIMWATAFLADGGRMAFVLPGAVLQADYAEGVWKFLMPRFSRITTVRMDERLFPDASAETVLLLGEGYNVGAAECRTHIEIAGREALTTTLERVAAPANGYRGSCDFRDVDSPEFARLQAIDPAASELLRSLSTRRDITRLGAIAQVRIGVVTGANQFFVRSAKLTSTVQTAGAKFMPIIGRSSALRHPVFDDDDQLQRDTDGSSSRLIVLPPDRQLTGDIAQMVRDAETQKIHKRAKCAVRSPWWALRDVANCEAFLAYMGSQPPRLVLNRTLATCTNSIHRITWREHAPVEAAVIASWTSFAALSGELVGRHYGGGVLKLEIHEARKIMLPIVAKADGRLSEMNSISRRFGVIRTIQFADDLVLRQGLGLNSAEIAEIRKAAVALRERRRGGWTAGQD
jgi:adenine-specific DNA methylase